MRTLLVALVALGCSSCATVTMTTTCPETSTGVGFSLSGSTIGNTALSMLGFAQMAGKVPMAAAAASSSAPATSATMTYKYLPIFGADAGSLNCVQPPQQTVVVTSPPATVVH